MQARWPLLLIPVVGLCLGSACHRPQQGAAVEATSGPPAAAIHSAPEVLLGDSREGLKHLWVQEETMVAVGNACPFSFQRKSGEVPSFFVEYEQEGAHSPPYALHMRFTGAAGTSGGWGVGCMGYNAEIFKYLRFQLKGEVGQQLQFRLSDNSGQEGTLIDLTIEKPGWQPILLPLSGFRGLDIKSLKSLMFLFKGELGPADVYLDDLEFLTQ